MKTAGLLAAADTDLPHFDGGAGGGAGTHGEALLSHERNLLLVVHQNLKRNASTVKHSFSVENSNHCGSQFGRKTAQAFCACLSVISGSSDWLLQFVPSCCTGYLAGGSETRCHRSYLSYLSAQPVEHVDEAVNWLYSNEKNIRRLCDMTMQVRRTRKSTVIFLVWVRAVLRLRACMLMEPHFKVLRSESMDIAHYNLKTSQRHARVLQNGF